MMKINHTSLIEIGNIRDGNMRDFLSNHIVCFTKDLFIIQELRMRTSSVNLSRLGKSVAKMVTGWLGTMKFAIFGE